MDAQGYLEKISRRKLLTNCGGKFLQIVPDSAVFREVFKFVRRRVEVTRE